MVRASAERMLRIARKVNSPDQKRIAREILLDISKADGLSAGVPVDLEDATSTERATIISSRPGGVDIVFEPPTKRCYSPSCPGQYDPEGLLKCGKCQNRWYCSKECQKTEWSEHKIVCKRAAAT